MVALAGAALAAAASYGAGFLGLELGLEAGSLGLALFKGAVGALVSLAFGMVATPRSRGHMNNNAQDRKQTVRGGTVSRRTIYGRARVGGVVAFTTSTGADKQYLDTVMIVAGHVCDGIEGVWINDVWVPVQAFASGAGTELLDHVVISWHDGTQTTADPALVSNTGGEWGNAMVLQGMAYCYVRLKYSQDKFANGFSSFSALVRGKKIEDTRTNTVAWSTNPAMCIRDYLLDNDGGLGALPEEIDEGWFALAANMCDEPVQLDADGTSWQKRYECDYAFTLDAAPRAIMDDMLTSCLGALVYVQGQYRMHPGGFTPPAVTLGPGDFSSEITVQTTPAIAGLYNAIKGTFINPDKDWQASEFPEVVSTHYETEDGQRLYLDVEFPATNDPTRVQRLATQKLRRDREALVVKGTMKYRAVRFAVWDSVALSWPDFGWVNKPFRVIAWRYDPVSAGVEVELREDAPQSYAWQFDDAWDMPPALNSTLVNPLAIPPPTGVQLTPTTAINRDGAVVSALLVKWIAAAHPFVTAYEVQWNTNNPPVSGEWQSVTVGSDARRYVISPALTGQPYVVRVRAVAGLVRSPWSGNAAGFGAADTTPPGPCTDVNSLGGLRLITVRWAPPPDADLSHVLIEEYNPTAPGSGWYPVGMSKANFFVRDGLAPGVSLYHRVYAVDQSGNTGPISSMTIATSQRAVTNDIAPAQVSETFVVYGGAAETAGLWVFTDGSPILVQARARLAATTATYDDGQGTRTDVTEIDCVLRRNNIALQSATAIGAPVTAAFGVREILGGGWHLYDVVVTRRVVGYGGAPFASEITIIATVLKR